MAYFGKISTQEHYGLRLAIWLAQTYQKNKPITLSEISRHEKISVKYLEQLVRPYRQAGWVKSLRGRQGGYILTKNPITITLKSILDQLSNNSHMVECLDVKNTSCPLEKKCPSKVAWRKVQVALDTALKEITLAELTKN